MSCLFFFQYRSTVWTTGCLDADFTLAKWTYLAKVCQAKGITMVFSHVIEQPMRIMEKAGLWKS